MPCQRASPCLPAVSTSRHPLCGWARHQPSSRCCCCFVVIVLMLTQYCSSHIFWPLEHIFSYLLYLLSTWFGHMALLLDTFKWCLCMTRSRSLSCIFMRNSSCLISLRDTARALVSPLLFSCAFHTFSNTIPRWSYSLDLWLQQFPCQFVSL